MANDPAPQASGPAAPDPGAKPPLTPEQEAEQQAKLPAEQLPTLQAEQQAKLPAEQLPTLQAEQQAKLPAEQLPTLQAKQKPEQKTEQDQTFELLSMGTKGSIGLVFVCLVFACALCAMLLKNGIKATDALNIQILLSCIACFIGMALACLGFGLFLIQARGALSAQVGTGTGTGQLVTNAPGLAVMVCATIVIGMALNVPWTRKETQESPAASAGQLADSEPKGLDIPPAPASVATDAAIATKPPPTGDAKPAPPPTGDAKPVEPPPATDAKPATASAGITLTPAPAAPSPDEPHPTHTP